MQKKNIFQTEQLRSLWSFALALSANMDIKLKLFEAISIFLMVALLLLLLFILDFINSFFFILSNNNFKLLKWATTNENDVDKHVWNSKIEFRLSTVEKMFLCSVEWTMFINTCVIHSRASMCPLDTHILRTNWFECRQDDNKLVIIKLWELCIF